MRSRATSARSGRRRRVSCDTSSTNAFPQGGDAIVQRLVGLEILTRSQQPLREERGFDQVAAVVVAAEQGNHMAGAPTHEVRPGAVKPVGGLEKADDLPHARSALFAGDEATLGADDESHDAEAG